MALGAAGATSASVTSDRAAAFPLNRKILETVSLSPRGVTLAELAAAVDAAKSSVQELTNGLLAHGYLIEEERRFHLGPGPFILAARANKLAALSLDHRFVAELANAVMPSS
jgi:IclR family transcriptional regulator, acetate operon repressor